MYLNSEILSKAEYPVSFASHDKVAIIISNLYLELVDETVVYLFSEVINSILQYILSNYWFIISVLLE